MNSTISRAVVVAIALIALVAGYRACSAQKALPNPFEKTSRAYEPFAALVKRLSSDQALVSKANARIRAGADPKALGFEIADSGIRRLDDAALVQRMEFALKLVEHMDVATCAALVRPDAERNRQLQPKILKAIEQMSPADIERYFALVERAIAAELNGVPMPSTSQVQAAASIRRLAERFSDAERGVLMRVVNFPSMTTNDTSCWMVKTVFGEIMSMPMRDQQVLARVFSEPPK